jgi:hypothetical protein
MSITLYNYEHCATFHSINSTYMKEIALTSQQYFACHFNKLENTLLIVLPFESNSYLNIL